MIEKYYEALQKRENLRENLVGLRAQIKDEAAKEQFVSMIGDGGLLLELLEEEDPKVRKNVTATARCAKSCAAAISCR